MEKPCNKKIYPTEDVAKEYIAKIGERDGNLDGRKTKNGFWIKPIRTYWCEACAGWHLTSYTKAKWKMVQRIPALKQQQRIGKVAAEWIRKKGWDK